MWSEVVLVKIFKGGGGAVRGKYEYMSDSRQKQTQNCQPVLVNRQIKTVGNKSRQLENRGLLVHGNEERQSIK